MRHDHLNVFVSEVQCLDNGEESDAVIRLERQILVVGEKVLFSQQYCFSLFFSFVHLILGFNRLIEVGQHVLDIVAEHVVLARDLNTQTFSQVSE